MSLLYPEQFLDAKRRRCIIHFPGSSFNKNTLECVKAGLELLKRFPDHLNKMIVKVVRQCSIFIAISPHLLIHTPISICFASLNFRNTGQVAKERIR